MLLQRIVQLVPHSLKFGCKRIDQFRQRGNGHGVPVRGQAGKCPVAGARYENSMLRQRITALRSPRNGLLWTVRRVATGTRATEPLQQSCPIAHYCFIEHGVLHILRRLPVLLGMVFDQTVGAVPVGIDQTELMVH